MEALVVGSGVGEYVGVLVVGSGVGNAVGGGVAGDGVGASEGALAIDSSGAGSGAVSSAVVACALPPRRWRDFV